MKNIKLFAPNTQDPSTFNARPMILPIVFCLVCGVLLILFGNLAVKITAYVLAGILIVCGVWSVIRYIRSGPLQRITESRLALGLILLVAGTLLAFNPDILNNILPVVWGLALLFGAFLKFQYAFDEKSVKITKWWIMLIFAAVSLVIGILTLLDPAFLGESSHLIFGIMLLVEAAVDITVCLLLKHALKKHNSAVLDITPSAGTPDSVSEDEASVSSVSSDPQDEQVPETEA